MTLPAIGNLDIFDILVIAFYFVLLFSLAIWVNSNYLDTSNAFIK